MSMERFYRNYHKGRFVGFKVVFQQTDLWIGVDSYKTSMENCCLELVKSLYHQLMHHIERQPEFLKSLEPIEISEGPNIVRAMVDASKLANVGPMAAVAGAVADQMGNMLVESFNCDEVIVENGGDLFIKVCNPVNIGIYAGSSPLSGKIALEIQPGTWGVCTSSGTIGHSFSMGKADAVTIVAKSACVADAFATAYCNAVKESSDIQRLVRSAVNEHVTGVVVIFEDKIGFAGQHKIRVSPGFIEGEDKSYESY